MIKVTKKKHSGSDTPRSSGWVRWKAMIKLLVLKNNPDEKYFFITEKCDFEKKSHYFFLSEFMKGFYLKIHPTLRHISQELCSYKNVF